MSAAPPLPPEFRPDIAGLKEFARRTDRDDPLYFVGRDDEIRRLTQVLEDTAKAFSTGAGGQKGNTQLITAAPGAGKTALLEELARRWEREGRARAARLDASDLHDRGVFFREISLQLDPDAESRFGVTTGKSHTLGASQVIHATRTASEHSESPWPGSMTEVARWLAQSREEADAEGPPPPLVLMVDEIQNVAPLPNRESAPLREVHSGIREYPVLLVLAGLSDSESALAAAGISRMARNSRVLLGGLGAGEPEDAVRQFFDHFGVRGSEAERAGWARAIEADSGGWPQHLACGLSGAAEALIAAGGDLAEASLEDARAQAAAHRAEYYSRQLAPFWGTPGLLAEVIASLPARAPESPEEAGASERAVKKAIARAYRADPDLAEEMPRREAFPTLLRKGLIQDFGEGRYACPIPSFKAYMQAFCAEEGFPVAAREGEPGGVQTPTDPAPGG